MTNIAITAASGQLGRAIVDALTTKDSADTVIAIARTPDKARDLGVEVRQWDYAEAAGRPQQSWRDYFSPQKRETGQ